MNPQTAVRACSSSSSSSCAVVRIYRAKQTNSKNKWINTHCGSAGVCEWMWVYVCLGASECACLHSGLLFVCLCAYVCRAYACEPVCECMCAPSSPLPAFTFRCCWWNEWLLCLCISSAKSRPLLFHYALAKCCNTSNRAHAGLA